MRQPQRRHQWGGLRDRARAKLKPQKPADSGGAAIFCYPLPAMVRPTVRVLARGGVGIHWPPAKHSRRTVAT